MTNITKAIFAAISAVWVVIMLTGCRSMAVDHLQYVDYSAIYYTRAMQQPWTYSEFTNHVLSLKYLDVITPQSHIPVKQMTDCGEVSVKDMESILADTEHFYVVPSITSAAAPFNCYSFTYYKLSRDIYTKSLPQNLLNQITWGASGSGSTTLMTRKPKLFKAYAMCDKDGYIVRAAIERPFPSWQMRDDVITEFPTNTARRQKSEQSVPGYPSQGVGSPEP